MIRFACPTCKTVLQVADAQAGAVARCPRCRTSMRVPRPAPALVGPAGGPVTAAPPQPRFTPAAPGTSKGAEHAPSGPAPTLTLRSPQPPAARPPTRWRAWGMHVLHEIAQTGAATWGQTIRLARYSGGLWRQRSLRGKVDRARFVLGQCLREAGGGDPQLQLRLQSVADQVRAAEAAKTSTRALKSKQQALLHQLAAGVLSQGILPAGLEAPTQRARQAETALREQDERLGQARSALPPPNRTGWRRVATGYAALLGLCVLSLSLLAGGSGKPNADDPVAGAPPEAAGAPPEAAGDLSKLDSALKLAPADAAFYSSWLRNREQVEAVANSRVWAKLAALPAVKYLRQMAEAQLGQPDSPLAEFLKFYEQPENRELVELLLDLCSHEVFFYGGEQSIAFLDVFQDVYGSVRYGRPFAQLAGADRESAQLMLLYQALKENQDRLKAPDLVLGFKVSKKEAVEKQLKRLEQEYDKRLGQDAQFKGRLKRGKVGDHQFLTLQLDGKLVPWQQLPFKQLEEKPSDFDKLVKKLSALRLTVSLGLRDGYLLVGIGESTDHLARFGQGRRLIDQPEFKPLARFADRRLTSVGYASKALNAQVTTNKKDIDDLVQSAREGLDQAQLPAELRRRIDKDLDVLAKDLKSLVLEPGPALSFAFLTERGYEGYAYNWGEPGPQDSSKPLTLLKHLGGSPLAAMVGRSKPPPEAYPMLVKWLKVVYGYADELLVPQLERPQKEQYQQLVKEFLPLLRRLDEATAKLLLPALADGQSALVLDARLSSKQWLQALPATEKPLPLPEPALLVGVSDAALLEKAVAEYRAIMNEALAKGQKLAPGQVPELKLPEPKTRKMDGGTLYSFPLPAELGVDAQLAPTAGFGESVALLTLSPEHGQRLLKPTPLQVDSKPLGDMDRPLAGAAYVNCAGLIEALAPWVELAVRSAGAALPAEAIPGLAGRAQPAADPEDTLKQVRAVLDVLKVFRSYSSATYSQDGATVTHSETVIRDLEK